MTSGSLAEEVIRDLLRSCWLAEAARRGVYEEWSKADRSWDRNVERADQRARLLEEALKERGARPDPNVAPAHTGWLSGVVGGSPETEPLGPIFVARLGDWVEAHGAPFLGRRTEELQAIGEAERAEVRFPTSLPKPPAFEPLEPVEVTPPGEVLFRFAILGDAHIGSPGAEERVRAALSDIAASGAEMVIQLGDVTDHGDEDEFVQAARLFSGSTIPVHPVIGNHDIYSHSDATLAGRERFERHLGRAPDGRFFEHRGFGFALLDSAEEGVSPFGPFDLITGRFIEGTTSGAVVRGGLTPAQHEVLADVAAPDAPPTFVFLHHPPQPFAGFPAILFGLRDADSGRLHAVTDSGNVWGVFAGHTHRNHVSAAYEPVPVREVAIPRDFPFGYALVDVTPDGYAYTFHQISDVDLVRSAYAKVTSIHVRYALGDAAARGFTWRRPA